MKSPVAVRVSFNTLSASESAFAPEVAALPKADVALFALSIKVCVPPVTDCFNTFETDSDAMDEKVLLI